MIDQLKKNTVTILLIAANVLMFLLESASGGSENTRVAMRFGAYYYPALKEGGEWYRLLTSMFLHFGPEHLGGNMVSLYVLGSFVERTFGKVRFLVIYLFSGLAGNLLVYAADSLAPAESWAISAGASGAICGLMGVFLVLALLPRMKGMFPLRRVLIAVLLTLAPGFTDGSINLLAHLGGMLGGFVITWPVWLSCRRGTRRGGTERREE